MHGTTWSGALVERLGRYLTLTGDERETLRQFHGEARRLDPGEVLIAQDDENERLFVVEQGWFAAARELGNGGRQIFQFHFPGDIVGIYATPWRHSAATVTAVTDAVVSEVPKVVLGRLFAERPRLAALLHAIAATEMVAMGDRLTAVGRLDASDRLAVLLLDIRARLKLTMEGVGESFDLPLTQAQIGDAIGLTNIHVSRTLGAMTRDGLVVRDGRRVRIADPSALAEKVGFIDRYAHIDTSWLPSA